MSVLSDLANKFSSTNSESIGKAVDDLVTTAITRRRMHERRWYDNNFFDDGYHFRVISKKTGRVVDHVSRSTGYVERAIPRASRQIRGVSNLLFAAEPYPVVYPERISIEQFKDQTGQVNQDAFVKAMERSKDTARKQGIWLQTEWEEEQQLPIKLIDMILLAAKNSIAYLQIYSDTDKQKIITEVFDAFDIVLYGDHRDLKTVPFITKVKPMPFQEVLTNPMFDEKMLAKLSPDNRYATSEIKEAYMRSRYGNKTSEQDQATLLVKETFMKEYLTEENWKNAVALSGDTGAMEGKSKGDIIMRHPFSAGGMTLKDEYVDYDEYPFAAFRFEPGPLYQTPFIERFIPQNKSLDIIVTRLEKWVNAMIIGVYQMRKGENFQISNFPGGQILEYETTPLAQMNQGSVGQTPFAVIELLNKFIDEQGATTAAGLNVPKGVKAGIAIESVKSTEYANLKISTLMLKDTIKYIAECMLERADKDYLQPHTVQSLEDGEPNYFDVIGQRGMQLSQKVDKALPPDVVPLKKDTKVRIEIEPGLGLTMDGKRQAMEQIINYMLQLSQAGLVTQEALTMVVKRFLETFGYGSTQEFMEAMETGTTQEGVTQETLQKMQIALLQALKDAGAVGQELEQKMTMSTQVGVVQALKDTGMIDKQKEQPQPKSLAESLSIQFKDLPEDTKSAVIQALGFPAPQTPSPAGTDQVVKKHQAATGAVAATMKGGQPNGKANGTAKK
jgi:hypothetical protein